MALHQVQAGDHIKFLDRENERMVQEKLQNREVGARRCRIARVKKSQTEINN